MDDDASSCDASGGDHAQRRASAWLGPRLASWLLVWRSSSSAVLVGGLALTAVLIGTAYQGPLHATGTAAPGEVAAAVMADTPDAASIRYAHHAQGPGIPDPSPPDAVAVEFRQSGTVCTGRVTGLTGGRRTLTDVVCGNDGLQAREASYIHPGWATAGGVLAIVSGLLAVWARFRRTPAWPA